MWHSTCHNEHCPVLHYKNVVDVSGTRADYKSRITKVWAGLVEEIEKKLQRMQLKLHLEFMNMNMNYEKGADLQEQFNLVSLQYEALSNVGIPVSDDDYRSLVINFVPPELSSFLVTDLALDAVWLMQVAVEEWDRHEAEKRSASRRTEEDMNTRTDLMVVSDMEPKMKSGGRKSRRRRNLRNCFNCGCRGTN